MKNSALQNVEKMEEWIRSGRGSLARAELVRVAHHKVPRSLKARLANLASRTNLSLLGVRLLNALVRPTRKSPATATEEEKAEYANCLTRIGANNEAFKILASLDPEKFPQVWLYVAGAHITGWNYERAIPELCKYISCPSVEPYRKLVAKVNLGAAFIHEGRYSNADILLRQLLEETQRSELQLLHGNSLELASQNFISQKKWEEAQKILSRAKEFLKHAGNLDEFFVRKSEAILTVLRDGANPSSLGTIRGIREEATKRPHWETVRDCDRIEAIATRNEGLLIHLHMGTPHEPFKRHLLEEFGGEVSLPSSYLWKLSETTNETRVFDLRTGIVGTSELKVGQARYRLLSALCSDFYRPFRIATLHDLLYPDEYFNPESAPLRIHFLVKKLRKWFSDHRFPLTIAVQSQQFRVKAAAPCAIRVYRQTEEVSRQTLMLERLKQRWPEDRFSLEEAASMLGISSRSMQRVVKKAVDEGNLHRHGKRAFTRYSFSKSNAPPSFQPEVHYKRVGP